MGEEPVSEEEVREDVAGTESGEQERQMALPMLQIVLPEGVPLSIGVDEQGNKAFVLGPVALQFVLPISREAALATARTLSGGLELDTNVDRAAFESAARLLANERLIVKR